MINRQRREPGDGGAGGLGRRNAEIGTHRRGGLHGQARSAGKAKLSSRNNRVCKQIAGNATLAAETLPELATQSQPLHWPIFGERAALQSEIDITKAVERTDA